MRRVGDVSSLSPEFRIIILFIFLLFFHGCSVWHHVREKVSPVTSRPVEKIERNKFSCSKGDGVIGRLAIVRLEKGDTLPDVARHFGLGINEIGAANPGVDVWVPDAGEHILLPLSFILPDVPRKGIVINTAAMRLFQYKDDGKSLVVSTYPVGIGSKERPTPTGQMHVERKVVRPTWHVPASILKDHQKKGDPLPAKVLPGPKNPLGEYALYLNKSNYVIHGTNKPASIGLKATNGCLRLYPEDIKRLYDDTNVKTPVHIVNQPYLIGIRDGVVYMEVHSTLDNVDVVELKKMYSTLKNVEKKSGRKLDWKKVHETLAEARGIPVPIFEVRPGSDKGVLRTVEVKHPGELYGRPKIPKWTTDGWYVLAAEVSDETHASRLAAMINHQGPPIPARVIPEGNRYRVIAGPFSNNSEAKEAARRLKVDLEINGLLIEPARK